MKKAYVLVPDKKAFLCPFDNEMSLLSRLVVKMKLEDSIITTVTWRKAVAYPQYFEKVQIAIMPVANIYKVSSRKSKSCKIQRLLAETSDDILNWSIQKLINLKMLVAVSWTDSLRMQSVQSNIFSFDSYIENGVQIVYLELENVKSLFETLLYFVCSVSRYRLKSKSLIEHLNNSSNKTSTSICKKNSPVSIDSLSVLFIGLESPASQMLAEALSKLFKAKIIYHQTTQLPLPYYFESHLIKALQQVNVVIIADDIFIAKKHWDSIKALTLLNKPSSHLSERKYFLDQRELSSIRDGTHLICTTRVKCMNFETLHCLIRQNHFSSVCLCLPVDCCDSDISLVEDISFLENVLVMPAASSQFCTPEQHLDTFIELIMRPIRSFHEKLNSRTEGSYLFKEHYMDAKVVDTQNSCSQVNMSGYIDKITEIVSNVFSVNEKKCELVPVINKILKKKFHKFRAKTNSVINNKENMIKKGLQRSHSAHLRNSKGKQSNSSFEVSFLNRISTRSTSLENIPEIECSFENETSFDMDLNDQWTLVKKELNRITTVPLVASESVGTLITSNLDMDHTIQHI